MVTFMFRDFKGSYLNEISILQIYEIIGFVYQYIKLLRQVGPQEWIYRELQDIANMDFTFAEEQPQDEYAAELSGISFGFNIPFRLPTLIPYYIIAIKYDLH